MPEEVKKLIQEYQEGKITRREFIRRAVAITGSLAATNALIQSFIPSIGYAAQVDPGDTALVSNEAQYAGKAGTVSGYLSRPKASGKYPAIIVIHENRGLNDHIRDVARRVAKEGYVALAPDFLSRQGGTQKANPKGEGLSNMSELAPWQGVAEDTDSGFAYLRGLSEVRGDRLGVTGFCWGGGQTFNFTTESNELAFAVPFYGAQPPAEKLEKISCPILGIFAESDNFVNQNLDAFEAKMKELGKNFSRKMFPGTQHAFMNFTSPQRYNAEQARAAWAEATAFVKKVIG